MFQTEGTPSVVRYGDAAEEGLELTLERDGARLGQVRHRGGGPVSGQVMPPYTFTTYE